MATSRRRSYAEGGIAAPDLTGFGGGATSGLMRAMQGNTAAQLALGVAGLVGTIQKRREREEKEAEREHEKAGNIAWLKEINILQGKIREAQGREDWMETTSVEREKEIGKWIEEGQAALSDWADGAAWQEFTSKAGVLGSQPVIAARERERTERKTELLSEVVLAHDNLIEGVHDNANLVATGTPQEAEAAFQAIQAHKGIYDASREAVLPEEGLSAEQKAMLREQDGGDDIVSLGILKAHISHAVKTGTVDDLANKIYKLKDPEGNLLTQGLDPSKVDGMVADAQRESTAESNRKMSELALLQKQLEIEATEESRKARTAVAAAELFGGNGAITAQQQMMKAAAEGNPDLVAEIGAFAKNMSTNRDANWQEHMKNDPEVRLDYHNDSLDLLNATSEEDITNVQDRMLRACQNGRLGMEGGMPDEFCTSLELQATTAQRRVSQLGDEEKEVVRLLAPVLRAAGQMGSMDPIGSGTDVADMGMLSAIQNQAVKLVSAGGDPQFAVDLASYVLDTVNNDPGANSEDKAKEREITRFRMESAVANLFGPNGMPKTQGQFIDELMRDDVLTMLDPVRLPDGTLPRKKVIIDRLKEAGASQADAALIFYNHVVPLENLYLRGRGLSTPVELAAAASRLGRSVPPASPMP